MKSEKQFDAVRMMREIRDWLSQEMANMSFEEEKRYLSERLAQEATETEEVVEESKAA